LGGDLSPEASRCAVVAVGASNITCSCPISYLASSSFGGRRRLQDTNVLTHNGGMTLSAAASSSRSGGNSGGNSTASYSVTYVAMLSAIQDNFVSTVVSAGSLNASTVQHGWSALVTIGTVAAAIVLALYGSHQADAKMDKISPGAKKEVAQQQIAVASRVLLGSSVKSASGGGKAPDGGGKSGKVMSKSAKRSTRLPRTQFTASRRAAAATGGKGMNRDLQIAEQALPMILSSTSLTNKIVSEIKQHHKWLGVIFFFSRTFPRMLRVASLATNIVIMLFIQAITYSLTNPDDGSCEKLTTEAQCLEASSPYATGESKCGWDYAKQTCFFNEPDGSLKIILFVAIFSALLSTPLALFVDWLIMSVLSAPTRPPAAQSPSPGAAAVKVAPVDSSGELNSATAVGLSDAAHSRGRRRGGAVANISVGVEAGESPSPTANATGGGERVLQKRASVTGRNSTLGSIFGLLAGGGGGAGSASESALQALSSQAQLNAQADLRQLASQITAYRTTLTTQELAEFDGMGGLLFSVFVSFVSFTVPLL
jgi:hypothetical protein